MERYVCFVVLVLLVARGGGRQAWRPVQPGVQITRSLVLVVEMLVFIVAVKYLPLADVHGVGALCPLLTSALAVVFLGERVTGRFLVALVVACAGALLIVGPDFMNARWEIAWALVGSGVIVTAGHYLLIKALEWADASFLQPFQLTIFPWAVVFGLVAFGDRPRLMMLIGAGIVVAANVYAARAPATDATASARSPGGPEADATRRPNRR